MLDVFLPGILGLLAFSTGAGAGFSTIFELRAGVIERFRVIPASRFAILAGPILSGMTMMFAFDAIVVAVGAAFGFHVHWLGLAVLAVLLALLMTTAAAFSIATALLTKDISSFAAIINGLNLPLPLLLLAGVLLPISRRRHVLRSARLAGVRRAHAALRRGSGLGHRRVPRSRRLTRAEQAAAAYRSPRRMWSGP